MTAHITEEELPKPEHLLLPARPVGGWMAWAKHDGAMWMQLCPMGGKANWGATPGMLFTSRDEAIKQASEMTRLPTELKIFYVELEK